MKVVRESYLYFNVIVSKRIPKRDNYPFLHFLTEEHFKSLCRYSYSAANLEGRERKRKIKKHEYAITCPKT